MPLDVLNAPSRVTGRREDAPMSEEDMQAQQQADTAQQQEQMRQQLGILVARIERQAEEQVTKKRSIEDRWLEDLRQYHGRYSSEIEKELQDKKRSRVFANLTRPKTHSWEGRLGDMLFPTDDRNWGIQPTPVPLLLEAAKAGADDPDAEQARQIMQMATAKANAMQMEIDDQLTESNYTIECRKVIHDAVKVGTGILKGPTYNDKVRRSWSFDKTSNTYVLAEVAEPKPGYGRVDPWNFLPDMSACHIREAEFTYERHPLNRKDFRKLGRTSGFDADAVRRVLQQGPSGKMPTYYSDIRVITDSGMEALEDRFIVWEYHGALEVEEIRSICSCTGDQVMLDAMDQVDPLDEVMVVAWVCQGELLKFGPHPMETGDSLYSVYNFEKDDVSIFGRGVPNLMRDAQSAVNGAWRMVLDNGGATAGPQVMVDKTLVEPQNGQWDITPFKVWLKTKPMNAGDTPFGVFNLTNNQAQLAAIMQIARQLCDDETNMPLIAEGQQASYVTQTAQGMSMLMNAVNVVFRAAVKNFDDDITTPTIRRAYDWNMQHNPKQEIKGDFDVDARGSSVLLVREIQAQNLMVLALQFAPHPIFGPMTKALNLYRKLYEAHQLSPDEFVKDENEIASDQKNNPPQPDPKIMALENEMNIAHQEGQVKIQVALIGREIALTKLAEARNMTVDQLRGQQGIKTMEVESKERMAALDAAMTSRQNIARQAYGAVPAPNAGVNV